MIENVLVSYSLFFSRFFPITIGLGILLGLIIALKGKRGGERSPLRNGWVIRHGKSVIVTHWINAGGMIACLITGMLLLKWIKSSAELHILYLIHYIGASAVIFALGLYLSQQGVSGGRGLIARRGDLGKAVAELFEYKGVLGDKGVMGFKALKLPGFIRNPLASLAYKMGAEEGAPTGKYLPVERVLSFPVWVVLIAGTVITGGVKLIKYIYPVSEKFLYWITTIHDFLTYLVLIMLILHVAAVVLVKANWPLLKSMFTSTVPEEYVKEHHPLWYKEIKGER